MVIFSLPKNSAIKHTNINILQTNEVRKPAFHQFPPLLPHPNKHNINAK